MASVKNDTSYENLKKTGCNRVLLLANLGPLIKLHVWQILEPSSLSGRRIIINYWVKNPEVNIFNIG